MYHTSSLESDGPSGNHSCLKLLASHTHSQLVVVSMLFLYTNQTFPKKRLRSFKRKHEISAIPNHYKIMSLQFSRERGLAVRCLVVPLLNVFLHRVLGFRQNVIKISGVRNDEL